jgi:hypothetical protein
MARLPSSVFRGCDAAAIFHQIAWRRSAVLADFSRAFLRQCSLAPGFLFELVNQRGRRPVHIVGWMVLAIVINPSRHLFGTLPFGGVAF